MLLMWLCCAACAHAQGTAGQASAGRPRVALVLSGGGAKGMAHIGVLEVLEGMGIPIDMVCGTSIGSLVGGLYALGYDAPTLDSLVRTQDWDFLLSDRLSRKDQDLASRQRQNTYIYSFSLSSLGRKGLTNAGLIRGQNLSNLFSRLSVGYHDSIDFQHALPIPFACVATDMVRFEEVDFTSGYISQAMRASMSIPAAFAPVRLDSMVLVDGGLMNNYPADLARKLGADFVIGVSLQKETRVTAADLQTTGDMVNQLINVNTRKKYVANWAATDVAMRVDVEGFGTASFTARAVDSLIQRGRRAALAHADELLALRRRVMGGDTVRYHRPAGRQIDQRETAFPIAGASFCGVAHGDERYLRQRFGLHRQEGQGADSLTLAQIEQIISLLRGQLHYNDAEYTLTDTLHGKRLGVTAHGKQACAVSVGARFDIEEKAALQFHALFPLHTRQPLTLEATGRLGESLMGRAAATLNLRQRGSVGLSYQFWHRDVDIYQAGRKAFNSVLSHHQIDLTVAGMQVRNLSLDAVARVDRADYDTDIGGDLLLGDRIDGQTLISYHARLGYDSQDDGGFPTRGSKFQAEYGLYTTNGLRYHKGTALSAFCANWQTNLRISRRLSLQPLLYGRGVTGGQVPAFLANYVGGPWFGHYAEQQLPLAGVGHMERADNYFAAVQLSAREQFLRKHYVFLALSCAAQADRPADMLDGGHVIGGLRTGYAYASPLGPASASLGYSTLTKRVSLYVNLGYFF